MKKALCQVVGFGPAALGVAVAADRGGVLDRLLGEGLVFLDRHTEGPPGGRRLPYLIESNSAASDFLGAVDPAGAFAEALAGPAARLLSDRADRHVPLAVAGAFLDDLAQVVAATAPDALIRADVASLRRGADGTWTSGTADDTPLVTSRFAVLATGGHEDTALTARRHSIPPSRVLPSGELLAGKLTYAVGRLRAGGHVAILGGSHSAFAAAALLLDRLGDQAPRHGIHIVHRTLALGHSRPWGTDRPAVAPAMAWEVCQETGVVNRFHGLRGVARELCLKALSGSEDRLVLHDATHAPPDILARADLVVHATGYRTRQVPLYDVDGRPVALSRSDGAVDVDDECRVTGADGAVVPGLFGLGLGYARQDPYGRRRVGVNVFHGTDADHVVRAVSSVCPA
ncbi:hypothetical protein ACFWWT_36490 [Streptomyces sp. NPDC058676]|uniref:hypothetical protein n=1 Tax=unclassified Streptomyces TaxID=2593676 RepID=UPI00365EE2F3